MEKVLLLCSHFIYKQKEKLLLVQFLEAAASDRQCIKLKTYSLPCLEDSFFKLIDGLGIDC